MLTLMHCNREMRVRYRKLIDTFGVRLKLTGHLIKALGVSWSKSTLRRAYPRLLLVSDK